MHIPDGFLSPATYLPATAVAAGLIILALKRTELDADRIAGIAAISAFSFVAMLFAIPMPGGTSVHLGGVGLMAVLFGPWTAFGALSLVLLVQALLFGEGGVTAYGVHVIAIAFAGTLSAYGIYHFLKRVSESIALFAAGWMGLVVPAVIVAAVLGIQPLIAHDAWGKPLFFPFGLEVTLPSIVIPHLIAGVAEGAVTVMMVRFVKRYFKGVFYAA
ncbi:energy-coupling factor ABC transporter permease [Sulfurimonas diazotrophicus]|uniref:Energy-coupling factor ABC transporter permease n=1 Tax=Sulfurimonas diazotrophicus TaxID=3131939 RepID=A0ABZ3H8E7_9BACT